MRKDDDNSPASRAAMDHALAWSRNVFEAQVRRKTGSVLVLDEPANKGAHLLSWARGLL